MSETLNLGLMATVYGMAGVFAVLVLFYILTKVMMHLFKR